MSQAYNEAVKIFYQALEDEKEVPDNAVTEQVEQVEEGPHALARKKTRTEHGNGVYVEYNYYEQPNGNYALIASLKSEWHEKLERDFTPKVFRAVGCDMRDALKSVAPKIVSEVSYWVFLCGASNMAQQIKFPKREPVHPGDRHYVPSVIYTNQAPCFYAMERKISKKRKHGIQDF